MQMRSSLIKLVQVKKYDSVDREGKIHRRELTSFSCDSRIIRFRPRLHRDHNVTRPLITLGFT